MGEPAEPEDEDVDDAFVCCERVAPFPLTFAEASMALSFSLFCVLVVLLARPGGILTANSCTPGIGGGRKEDEGDGNGDDEGGTSMHRDSLFSELDRARTVREHR